MKLEEAREIMRETRGNSYSYLKNWGLSTIKEAIRTVRDRKAATKDDLYSADILMEHILRGENY